MRVLVLLCCVWLAGAGTVPEKCDGVTFDGKYYDKQVLLNVSLADEFSYVKSTNTLFFSYSLPEVKTDGHFKANGYYNIDTKDFAEIPEVPGGSKTTIDPDTEDVFLAGGDGVFKFNSKTKEVERYAAKGVNIYFLFFYKNLYFTTLPFFKLYCYKDGNIEKVTDVSVERCIGDDKEYIYTNSDGLFSILERKEESITKFVDPEDNINYRAFAKDKNNKIYVFARSSSGVDAVYTYTPNGTEKTLQKVAEIEDIIALAFDKDNNVIYSNGQQIVKLTPSKDKCPVA